MATETDTATEQPVDDLRSALNAAFDDSAKPEPQQAPTPGAAASETDVADAPEPPEPTDGEKLERARGPDGKFIAADKTAPDVADKAKPKVETAEQPGAEPQPAADKQDKALQPVAMWPEADKQMFRELPAKAQEFLLNRHKAMEADYTRKTQAVAHLRNEYEPVDQMFAPYRDAMRAKGFTPRTLIEGWANVEKRLVDGDGVAVVKGLIDGYGIDRRQLFEALGVRFAPPNGQTQQPEGAEQPAAPAAQTVQLPPALEQELRRLSARQDAFERQNELTATRAQEAEQSRVMTEIEQFRSADDGKGNLLHPYFAEVEDEMVVLANGYRARGAAPPPLAELYEQAVWANPATRDKLITANRQAEEQKRQAEAKAKAAAARRAGSSVTGAPGPGQAPQQKPERSLREELEANASEVAAA